MYWYKYYQKYNLHFPQNTNDNDPYVYKKVGDLWNYVFPFFVLLTLMTLSHPKASNHYSKFNCVFLNWIKDYVFFHKNHFKEGKNQVHLLMFSMAMAQEDNASLFAFKEGDYQVPSCLIQCVTKRVHSFKIRRGCKSPPF